MTDRITHERTQAYTQPSTCHALLYFAKGAGGLTDKNGTRAAKSGTLVLLSPGDGVRATSSEDGVLYAVSFHLSLSAHPFLAPLFLPFRATPRERVLSGEDAAFFATVLGDMERIPREAPHAQQLLLAALLPLLSKLAPTTGGGESQAPHKGRGIAPAVMAFVDAHIGEAISLDDIAAALFISKYHMSHLFKAETGLSVGEAVLRRKVEHAEALLASGTPAHRVCELVGFNHYSAFFRIYKRIKGHSPTQY